MDKKEKLANQYIELKKEFDGEEFNEVLTENQIWYNKFFWFHFF